jgi:hypothetical protein
MLQNITLSKAHYLGYALHSNLSILYEMSVPSRKFRQLQLLYLYYTCRADGGLCYLRLDQRKLMQNNIPNLYMCASHILWQGTYFVVVLSP